MCGALIVLELQTSVAACCLITFISISTRKISITVVRVSEGQFLRMLRDFASRAGLVSPRLDAVVSIVFAVNLYAGSVFPLCAHTRFGVVRTCSPSQIHLLRTAPPARIRPSCSSHRLESDV